MLRCQSTDNAMLLVSGIGNDSVLNNSWWACLLLWCRCPICSLQYRRCSDLNRHMKSKHSVSRKAFLECNTADDEEEIFEMDDEEFNEMEVDEIPGSDYSDESQPLSELMTKGKQATQMINKKCSYCSYIAKWPSDLRRHMRVHSVVKRFKCSLCWKKYKYLGDLNVHMRRDHEVTRKQERSSSVVFFSLQNYEFNIFSLLCWYVLISGFVFAMVYIVLFVVW